MTRSLRRRVLFHENLEALLSARRGEHLHAVAASAPAYGLFADSLPPSRLLSFHLARGGVRSFLNDDAVVRCSDLSAAAARAGARAFVPSYRSSPFLERWARGEGIELLSPSAAIQRNLEDKLAFDRLLRAEGLPAPRSLELTRTSQVSSLRRFPTVCQLPRSEGMEGTFLVASRRALRRRLAEGSLELPLLCRDYEDGRALGITIVVGARQILLSAVRDQCRVLAGRKDDLAGIQWVARRRLDPEARRSIEGTMAAVGGALRRAGLLGAASVDFVLDGARALVIECNPRFSSASPLLSLEPSLLHGLDFLAEHLRAVRGLPLSAHRPRLPRSSFEGAYVDFSDHVVAALRALGRRVVRSLPEVGVHEVSAGEMRFVSRDVADLRGRRRLLFHCSSRPGERIGRWTDLGSLYTTFPLFDFQGTRLRPTAAGEAVLAAAQEKVRFGWTRATLRELLDGEEG